MFNVDLDLFDVDFNIYDVRQGNCVVAPSPPAVVTEWLVHSLIIWDSSLYITTLLSDDLFIHELGVDGRTASC